MNGLQSTFAWITDRRTVVGALVIIGATSYRARREAFAVCRRDRP